MHELAIKICGLKSSSDVEASLRARATHIGLVFFAKSPRNVSLGEAARLADQARGVAKIVGLFVDPDREQLDAVRAAVHLDAIQLHGDETPAFTARVRQQHGIEVWKAILVRSESDLAKARRFLGGANRVLYDAKPPMGAESPGGSGLRFDWNLLADHRHSLPWILAGGLDPRNVKEAIAVTRADFVDVSSGVESAPGLKDAGKIAAFCAAARSA